MKCLKIIVFLCILISLITLSAGCTGNGTPQDETTASATQPASPTQTPAWEQESAGEYSIDKTLPSDIKVEISAKPVSSSALLISYNLDLSSMGTAMNHEGWGVILTAYAYNTDDMEPDFSVDSYNDIILAGIPYKSNNIRIYPGNVYPDRVEVSENPDSKMTLNTDEYYNFGIVLREAW